VVNLTGELPLCYSTLLVAASAYDFVSVLGMTILATRAGKFFQAFIEENDVG
jgi:hypothetical protein